MSFSRMGGQMSRLYGRELVIPADVTGGGFVTEGEPGQEYGRAESKVQAVARDPKRIGQARQELQGPRGGTKE